MPWIDGDGAKLDCVKQCEQISADNPRQLLSTLGFYHLDPDLGRRILRSFLLVEALPVYSVGESLQNERAIPDRRKNEVRDARVVPHHIALRVLPHGEKDLVEVGDLEHFSAAEVESPVAAPFLDRRELPLVLGELGARERLRTPTRFDGLSWNAIEGVQLALVTSAA